MRQTYFADDGAKKISKFIIPMHTCPVPLYPSLHVHSYEPLVFTQVAFTPQMMLEFAHSSISEEKR